MITINIEKIKAEAAAKIAHKPVIRIILPAQILKAEERVNDEKEKKIDEAEMAKSNGRMLKEALILDLNDQERDLRIERARQSNKYHQMIEAGASQGELAAHYQLIESISADIRDVYDKREHVEQYGRLPEQGSAQAAINHTDILALKEQRRSLVNRRSKLRAKIEKGRATGAKRLSQWELEIDQVDADYIVVQSRIKDLKND